MIAGGLALLGTFIAIKIYQHEKGAVKTRDEKADIGGGTAKRAGETK
ncbi:MAG: hypothetical protein ACTSU2_13865 [Promethearchaeota archaeon]